MAEKKRNLSEIFLSIIQFAVGLVFLGFGLYWFIGIIMMYLFVGV